MPLETLWNTRICVSRLDFLADSHFHSNYISSDALVGKMPHVDQCSPGTSAMTAAARPNGIWRMDTVGPTKTKSLHGFYHNTTWACFFLAMIVSPMAIMIVLQLSFLKFKSTGMQTLLGFMSFMEIPVCSTVTMLWLISARATAFREAHGIAQPV